MLRAETFRSLQRFGRRAGPRIYRVAKLGYWRLATRTGLFAPRIFRQQREIASSLAPQIHADHPARVLFFSMRQERDQVATTSTLAWALRRRGHAVEFVNCDRTLQRSCNTGMYPQLADTDCEVCYRFAGRMRQLGKVPTSWLGEYTSPDERAEARRLVADVPRTSFRSFEREGLPLGYLTEISVVHFMRTDRPDLVDDAERVWRDRLAGAVMMAGACERILERARPDVVVLLNGLFMPERVMLEVARRKGVRVVAFELGHRERTLLMHQDRPIELGNDAEWERHKEIPLTAEAEAALDGYLARRRVGLGNTQVNLFPEREERDHVIREALRLGGDRPIAVMFPAITWDSPLFRIAHGYKTQQDWIDDVIEFASRRKDFDLVIRAHPAESILLGARRDTIAARLAERWPDLPANVRLVSPDSPISSYTLMSIADFCLTYASTTGLETALLGKPTLLSGRAHYGGKGFTFDAASSAEYRGLLDAALAGRVTMTAEQLALARRYAYFVYFFVSVPFPQVDHRRMDDMPEYTYGSADDLRPGSDPNLDVFMAAILDGVPCMARRPQG